MAKLSLFHGRIIPFFPLKSNYYGINFTYKKSTGLIRSEKKSLKLPIRDSVLSCTLWFAELPKPNQDCFFLSALSSSISALFVSCNVFNASTRDPIIMTSGFLKYLFCKGSSPRFSMSPKS